MRADPPGGCVGEIYLVGKLNTDVPGLFARIQAIALLKRRPMAKPFFFEVSHQVGRQ